MRSSLQVRLVAAALLFTGGLGCFYWMYTHGGFYARNIEIPVKLVQGQSMTIRFSGRAAGDHYILLAYRKGIVDRQGKMLEAIKGKAVLSSDGTFVARANLPVYDQTSSTEFHAMVLFTVATERSKQYALWLEITQLPALLASAQAAIRVKLDPHYILILWQVGLGGLLMSLAAIACSIPLFRKKEWRREQTGERMGGKNGV
jgi:hypothetical protein